MMVSTRGSVLRLLYWQRSNTLTFLGTGALAAFVHHTLGQTWATLPTAPLAVVGGAIGIFTSFRTNSAYGRWWEGRKLWGRLINTTRHFSSQVMAYLPLDDDGQPSHDQRTLIRRQAAYVHALRCALRQQDPFQDDDFLAMLDGDPESYRGASNLCHLLLTQQLKHVVSLNAAGMVDDFRLSNLELSHRELINIQGGCERIKKTPFPRGYGWIAERLVLYFSCLFPLTVVAELHYLVVPVNLLVCMAFALISEAGRVLEDPFNMFHNALPLSQISRMIEVNTREILGDRTEDLPPMITADARGILM